MLNLFTSSCKLAVQYLMVPLSMRSLFPLLLEVKLKSWECLSSCVCSYKLLKWGQRTVNLESVFVRKKEKCARYFLYVR